jgi:phosphohistidine phosphatase
MMALSRAPAEVERLMLIGHNPGLGSLATSLCGTGSRKDLASMSTKFPTAGLAVISFDVEHWADITPGSGRLEAFVRPKDLD